MKDDWTTLWTTLCATALLSGVFAVFWTAPLMALPPDPQRPFTAQDCPAALARLAEAEAGNPLISAPEMAEVVLCARAQVNRLCPPSEAHPTETGPVQTETIRPEVSPIAPLPGLCPKTH